MPVASSERTNCPLVLLVEDDADLLQLAELVLEEQGIRVVTAPNGRLALSKLQFVKPDVIVTDMMMPELDGLAFLQEYARRPTPRAPVLAVSSFTAYLDQARQLGAAATLRKPYDAGALASKVRELARGRVSERAVAPTAVPFGDERARLRAIFDLNFTDPAPESDLPRFLDEVAALFGVAIAGISAVTADRQRLVVRCSTVPEDEGGPREHAFCTHAVAARSALVIQDALDNPLFRHNPSVTERGFRFYAGVPLAAPHGEAVGTLCILDFVSHHFTYFDLELLGVLSRRVLAALEWREKRKRPEVPDSNYRYLHQIDEQLGVYGRALFSDLAIVEASRFAQRGEPISLVAIAASRARLESTVAALRAETAGGEIGRLGIARLGALLPGKNARQAREIASRSAGEGGSAAAVQLGDYEGAAGLALLHAEQSLGEAGLY